MIICTEEDIKPGEIVNEGIVVGIDGEEHDTAFLVVEEVTVEDYIKQCREYNVCEHYIAEIVESFSHLTKFYKVQPD